MNGHQLDIFMPLFASKLHGDDLAGSVLGVSPRFCKILKILSFYLQQFHIFQLVTLKILFMGKDESYLVQSKAK